MNQEKIPFIRLAKRDGMESWKIWCIRAGAIVFALALGALVMGVVGANPITAYGVMISGALGKKSAIRQTVKIAVPLLGCALAIAPCFKMRFWNIGAEGQITAGAIAASYFALFWANRLPAPVLLTEQKMKGVAVIYVGEDLDVLLELCDRILVLCGGKVSGVVDARSATKDQIGLLMTRLSGKEGN